jgi:hypothetical protein
MDGPTSHVPRYARGYAAPPPDPMRRHVPTVGDRMHGKSLSSGLESLVISIINR